MKKILLVMLVTFHSLLIFGQATATIPDLIADPGSVVVPVNVSGFNNIGAITMYIDYDPSVVTYSSWNSTVVGLSAGNDNGLHRIAISYFAGEVGLTLTGTLVNIVFNYNSGTGNFTFPFGSEVADKNYNIISVQYTDGSINPSTSALVSIPQFLNQTPVNGLAIPLNVDFSKITLGVNSFTFIVEYDGSKLDYQYSQNINSAFATNIIITPQTSPTTRLSIVWIDALAPGSQLNGKLLDMVFNYSGGTSALVFDEPNCNMADHAVAEVPVVYTNGLVSPPAASVVTITAGTLTSPPTNTEVLIPVTANNLINIGAFDLLIDYSQSVLGFVGLANINTLLVPSNLAAHTTASGVGINWFDASTALNIPDDEKLFDLKFNYSSGSTALTFDQINCVITDFGLNPMAVNYINGAVSQASTVTAVIPDVTAAPGTSVEIPVNVTGFSDLGAISLFIDYSTTALNFTDIVNINPALLAGASSFSFNATGGKLSINWYIDPNAFAGINIPDNAKLFDMKFNYNAGTSALTFDLLAPCEVSKFDLSPIDVAYTDGSIGPITSKTLNLNLFLEGLFNTSTGQMNKAKDYVGGNIVDKYPGGTVADHITVELHDAAAYSTVIYQMPEVELNQAGTASVTVPSAYTGNYYLAIKQRNHIETVSAAPVSFANSTISYNFTTAAAQAYGNNQKLLAAGKYGLFAGDVSQDGSVDIIDAGSTNTAIRLGNMGYINTDINGDGAVDIQDAAPLNTNIRLGIQRQLPN